MNLKHQMKSIAIALLLATAQMANAAQPAPATQKPVAQKAVAQKVFATPEEAAKALVEAIRKHDKNLLLAVIGQSSSKWLSSGDEVADRHDKEKFLAAYDRKNSISKQDDNKAILLVGEDDWPFPAPIIRKGNGWIFDAVAGREELINRRVGRNELDTIQTLLAVVDAQREYAAGDPDGNGYHDYARRFISHKGKKDGLYWPVKDGEPLSPLGPLVGEASREGYGKKSGGGKSGGKPAAYHGYRYRLLDSAGQGCTGRSLQLSGREQVDRRICRGCLSCQVWCLGHHDLPGQLRWCDLPERSGQEHRSRGGRDAPIRSGSRLEKSAIVRAMTASSYAICSR